jgi:hypothetical protein
MNPAAKASNPARFQSSARMETIQNHFGILIALSVGWFVFMDEALRSFKSEDIGC